MKKPILFCLSALLLASLACTVAQVGQVGSAAMMDTTITLSPPVAQVDATNTPSPTARSTVLPGETPSNTPTPVCVVDAGFDGGAVNVRACPGVQCAILGNAFDGDALLLLNGGDWAHVRASDLTGYINSKFCEVQK